VRLPAWEYFRQKLEAFWPAASAAKCGRPSDALPAPSDIIGARNYRAAATAAYLPSSNRFCSDDPLRLALPAPAEQTEAAEAGGEQGECGGEWNDIYRETLIRLIPPRPSIVARGYAEAGESADRATEVAR
jgi:hypothetical protein